MACREAGLREERKHRNTAAEAAAVPSLVVGDALLFATMCIIGFPVEVHARDGSVYSGFFNTASVDNEYAIVLKQAKMIKKGNQHANVVAGSLIETLIVQSEDLTQVVAKGVRVPSNRINGHVGRDDVQSIGGHGLDESMNSEAKVIKSKEPKVKNSNKIQSRLLAKRENGFPDNSTAKTANALAILLEEHNERLDTMQFAKLEEARNGSVDGRQAADGSLEIQNETRNNPAFQDERMTQEVQGPNLSTQSNIAVNTPEEMNVHELPVEVSSGFSTALEKPIRERPVIDANSESRLNESSSSFLPIQPKSSSFKTAAKESKLNPGAKMFSPSTLPNRPGTAPLVPNSANVAYIPETYTVAPITAHQEIEPSSFSRSLQPVRYVPYDNVATGNGGNDYSSYVQPIIGQVVSRTQQPVRHGQYNKFQAMPTFIHHNPQNVMHQRVCPIVCMHPISSNENAFSPATVRPLLTPHQMHLQKHQAGKTFTGNVSARALSEGAQPYVIPPSSVPVSQPLVPVLGPTAVPGSNVFLSTKFS